jgi:CO dehydrogenase maturation factor
MKNSVNDLPAGMTKQRFLEYKIQTSLVETPSFDLIAMGRPEGPGCYCYANNLLRDILSTLTSNYTFTIIDNEAGMEHLSRRTAQDIDSLLMVSEPSVRGVMTAGKISRLLKELETRVKNKYLVLNRVRKTIPLPVSEAIESEGLNIFSSIPEDPALLELNSKGKDIWKLPSDSPAFQAVDQLMQKLI